MKKYILAMAVTLTAVAAQAKTLIVYYSYTNNVERIVTELRNQIEADVIEVEPAIDPMNVDLSQYSTIIVGTPLWWSDMAAPLQTFLFQRGEEMAGKNIGLIVSSASSGISGVEADAKRLIPDGKFLIPSLWIKSSQTP